MLPHMYNEFLNTLQRDLEDPSKSLKAKITLDQLKRSLFANGFTIITKDGKLQISRRGC